MEEVVEHEMVGRKKVEGGVDFGSRAKLNREYGF